jgi:hypothetical protein
MFKDSLVGVLPDSIFVIVDSGYQGILDYFGNALVPYKASKHNPLTDEQKSFNTMIGKLRVKIERIIRKIKIFRICKETYRGKGEGGGLTQSQAYLRFIQPHLSLTVHGHI